MNSPTASLLKLDNIPSPFDSRDYKFIATVAPKPFTDLRPFNRDIEDQGQQGSCTVNGLTNAIEVMTQRAGRWEDLSRQFIYYTMREACGLLGREGAYSIRDVLETARKTGICLESEWPYGVEREEVRPPDSAYASAATRKISRYEAVDISNSMIFGTDPQAGIDNIKSALAEGMPVTIAMAIGEKMFGLSGPLETQHYPLVDIPGFSSNNNPHAGGHCMDILGNRDDLDGFIAEGSWGRQYGDNGCILIPYACVRDMSEAWIIRGYQDMSFIDPALYEQQMQMVKMYVAVLGRAPELSGFKFWLGVLQRGEDTLGGIAQGMMLDVESRARFPTNGDIVVDMIFKDKLFANRVEVAAYFVLDLASDRLDVAKVVLDTVTEDPASVPLAKKRARQLIGGGGVL